MDDECLNAQAVLRDRPIAVEQGPSLHVKELRVPASTAGQVRAEWIETAAPQDPEVRNRCTSQADESSLGHAAATAAVLRITDVGPVLMVVASGRPWSASVRDLF